MHFIAQSRPGPAEIAHLHIDGFRETVRHDNTCKDHDNETIDTCCGAEESRQKKLSEVI
jgi:hypothetical protein